MFFISVSELGSGEKVVLFAQNAQWIPLWGKVDFICAKCTMNSTLREKLFLLCKMHSVLHSGQGRLISSKCTVNSALRKKLFYLCKMHSEFSSGEKMGLSVQNVQWIRLWGKSSFFLCRIHSVLRFGQSSFISLKCTVHSALGKKMF